MRIMLLGKKEVVNHKGKFIVAEKAMIDGIDGLGAIGQDTGFYGGNAKNVSNAKGYSAQWLILDKNNEVIDVAVALDELNNCSKAQLFVFSERYGKLFRKEVKEYWKVAELLEFLGVKATENAKEEAKELASDDTDEYDEMSFDMLVAEAEKREIKFEDGIDVTEELLKESLRKEV